MDQKSVALPSAVVVLAQSVLVLYCFTAKYVASVPCNLSSTPIVMVLPSADTVIILYRRGLIAK